MFGLELISITASMILVPGKRVSGYLLQGTRHPPQTAFAVAHWGWETISEQTKKKCGDRTIVQELRFLHTILSPEKKLKGETQNV